MFNWNNINPVERVEWIRGHFFIPTFSYVAPAWQGASVISLQFNYTATRTFGIKTLPTKPVGANFVPTIKYRVGLNVYRYKLWDDDRVVLQAPLYTNQPIKKNFVVEIWNLNGEPLISSGAALQIITSLRTFPTSLDVIADYEDNTVVDTVTYQQLLTGYLMPSADMEFFWNGDYFNSAASGDTVANWPDMHSSHALVQAVALSRPTVETDFPTAAIGLKAVRFTALRTLALTGINQDINTLCVVYRQNLWQSGQAIFVFDDGTVVQGFQDSVTPNLQIGQSGVEEEITQQALGAVRILIMEFAAGVMTYFVYDSLGVLLETGSGNSQAPNAATSLTLGGSQTTISQFIGWRTSPNRLEIVASLVQILNRAAGAPLFDFDSVGGSEWLDNS